MSSGSGSNPTITPGLLYHDAPDAIEWLCRVFGFTKRCVIAGENGSIAHAHLAFGNGGIMLSSAETDAFPTMCRSPRQAGGVGTVEIIVFVADPDQHFTRAVAEGAEILIPIESKPYGGRGYTCRDPEGHVWAFGNYDAWSDQGNEAVGFADQGGYRDDGASDKRDEGAKGRRGEGGTEPEPSPAQRWN